MPPFTKEDAKRFLNYFKPLYKEAGIELTEGKIEEIINAEPSEEVQEARKLQELRQQRAEAEKKYPRQNIYEYYKEFNRLYATMIKPATDPDSASYNARLQELSKTEKGQTAIVMMAINEIAGADMSILSGSASRRVKNYVDHFHVMSMMHISKEIGNAYHKAMEDEENWNLLPDATWDTFNQRQVECESAGEIGIIANCKANPLYSLFPPHADYDKIQSAYYANSNAFTPGTPLSAADNKLVGEFFGSALQTQDLEQEIAKKFIEERYLYTTALKQGHADWIVMDEKGKQLPDGQPLEEGGHYMVCNEFGEVRGYYLNHDFALEQTYAKMPHLLMSEHQKEFMNHMKLLQEMDGLSERFSGVFGPKLNPDPIFVNKAAKNLKDCDYALPENVPEEVGECVTMGAFLNPEIVSKLHTSSTHADATLENRTEYTAVDWLNLTDNRAENFDLALVNVRKKMTERFQKAEAGESVELKKDFERAAKYFAQDCMQYTSIGGKVSVESNYTVVMAEKFAKAIQDNHYGIADGLSKEIKATILMKANMASMYREGSRAKAWLQIRTDLKPEERKALIRRAIAVDNIKKMQSRNCEFPDVTEDIENITARFGNDSYECGNLMNDIKTRYNQSYRMKNPSVMDQAISEKKEELIAAVEATIPENQVEQLAKLPGYMLLDQLNSVKIDPAQVAMPEVSPRKATEAENADLKADFLNKANQIADQFANFLEESFDTGNFLTFGVGHDRIMDFSEKIDFSLNHTSPGILGPSDEFQAVEEAYRDLQGFIENDNSSARIHAGAQYLAELAQKYLDKKDAAGVNPEADDTAGRRYRDMQSVLKNANRIVIHASKVNEMQLKDKFYKGTDILRTKDADYTFDLSLQLKNVRKDLEAVDPFYHHSTGHFTRVQTALDTCIQKLEDYGKHGSMTAEEKQGLVDSLKQLQEMSHQYMLDRRGAGSNLGKARLAVITRINDMVWDKATQMEMQNTIRNTQNYARDRMLEQEAQKLNQRVAANDQQTSEYQKNIDAYHSQLEPYIQANLKSNPVIDSKCHVSKLAYKVKTEYALCNNMLMNHEYHSPAEIKTLKSMLADRMLMDMIMKERSEHKDAALEIVFAAKPTGMKKRLLEMDEVQDVLNRFIAASYNSRAPLQRELKEMAAEKLDLGRNFIIQKNENQHVADEAEPVKDQSANKQVVEEAVKLVNDGGIVL